MNIKLIVLMVINLTITKYAFCQNRENPSSDLSTSNVNGVFPHMTVSGDLISRSETGIGALMPWANKLWMISYVAHIHGSGIGLYEISNDMSMRKHPASVTGTFANRMVHDPSNQAIIGPHIIDIEGKVRTFTTIQQHRLTASMRHLTKPDSMVLFLTMEGLLFEANVYSLETKQMFNLVEELHITKAAQPHFKGGFTGNGRVVVANNSYDEREYLNKHKGGRLAEWDGKAWTVIDSNSFVEVTGKIMDFNNVSVYGNAMFATGWDRGSIILKAFTPNTKRWQTYRLPKGSQSWEHTWNTEWMRIREAQTERYIMDMFGIFYDLPVMSYGGNIWGIKPISNHLRIVPDFCFWRGMFVMAGDQGDNAVGQPQSNLLFQNIDDLWKYGKPSGWGAVWFEEKINKKQVSDPFLMTGFDKKMVHFKHDSPYPVNFKIEVDFLGNGSWSEYKTISVNGYNFHVFPDGFSAHWVRVTSMENAGKATVYFVYN